MEWPDYELLDSGQEARLERFGEIILSRPEPWADHSQTLQNSQWHQADALFRDQSGWIKNREIPEFWSINFGPITLVLRLSPRNKHIGIFPEQAGQWQWLLEFKIQTPPAKKLLNLFGHTGAATLAASLAGFEVTHVDASKPAINQGRENQRVSNMLDKKIRWIHEDAETWVDREIKRNSKYHAIILDPPTFGRGPKGQLWKNDRDLPKLLKKLMHILDPDDPQFILLNHYTMTRPVFPKSSIPNKIISGDHTLEPQTGQSLTLAKWYRLDFG